MTSITAERKAAIDAYWADYYERYDEVALERFLDMVDPPDELGCRRWTGNLVDGYGTFGYRGGTVKAHRWIYEWTVGPIPDGLDIDHLCRTRDCTEVTHMEPVTHRENVLRGEGLAAEEARRDHCIHGHPYTPENTYIRRYADGRFSQRQCRICKRKAARERYRRLRARV